MALNLWDLQHKLRYTVLFNRCKKDPPNPCVWKHITVLHDG